MNRSLRHCVSQDDKYKVEMLRGVRPSTKVASGQVLSVERVSHRVNPAVRFCDNFVCWVLEILIRKIEGKKVRSA